MSKTESPQLQRCLRYRALKQAKAKALLDGDPEVIQCISEALRTASAEQTINLNPGELHASNR
jgi:hypothetical protein